MLDVNQFHCGEALELARQLPDESIHCIVTSPPYYGLRDYGTAKWEGGDPACNHSPERQNGADSTTLTGGAQGNHKHEGFPGDSCPKCGARRIDKQVGLEETPEAYVNTLVEIFQELRRALRDDGTVWLNLGDRYAANRSYQVSDNKHKDVGNHFASRIPVGLKPKDLIGIPWRVALALQDDGWILRSDIIWHKTNCLPESVRDRPTKSHEYIFLLTKSPRYYYDQDAIREPIKTESIKRLARGVSENHKNINGAPGQTPHTLSKPRPNRNNSTTFRRNGSKREQAIPDQGYGTHRPDRENAEYHPGDRNKRTVWEVPTTAFSGAHFAVFPPALIEPMILAGCPRKVCAKCGAPWTRVTESQFTSHDAETDSQYEAGTTANRLAKLRQAARQNGGEYINRRETIGWQPTCDCSAATKAGIVLDPFMGSGTTAQIAIKNQRQWMGFELNPDYIELAKKRIFAVQPKLFQE